MKHFLNYYQILYKLVRTLSRQFHHTCQLSFRNGLSFFYAIKTLAIPHNPLNHLIHLIGSNFIFIKNEFSSKDRTNDILFTHKRK